MCGINGGWFEGGINPQVIEDSLQAMRHRGPDDMGTFLNGQTFLGNCRLSIIDLTGGRQPIFNEDGTIAVVLNGEIYNYRESISELKSKGHRLRTGSDTEVLVHLYEEYGTEMCEHLRGMFAFGLWDSRSKTLFVARDRFGKKPLYYTVMPKGLLFASELKALRKLATNSGAVWSVRDQSVYDYLSLGFIPQPCTVYDQVLALPPGSWMRFNGRDLEIRRYWDIAYEPKLTLSFADAAVRTRELVADAVRLRLRSDVPLGVFLSGGMDSSVIAYEASRALGESLQTFTIAMGDDAYDESRQAAATAEHLGVRNTILRLEVSPLDELQRLVRLYDQPYADESAIPSLAVSRMARQFVKVILNGDGGDELFAGYRRYLPARYQNLLGIIPSPVARVLSRLLKPWSGPSHRRSLVGMTVRLLRGLSMSKGERYLAWTTDMLTEPTKAPAWESGSVQPTEAWISDILKDARSSLDTQMRGDVEIILLSALLVKMDLATMGASLEGRSPLMDHVLAEFAARLPDNFKIHNGTTKAVLREAYKGLLPDQVLSGVKFGFEPPLLSWLQNELRPLVMDVLGASTAKTKSYVRGSFIDDLLEAKTIQDRNWAASVYSLLMLELWLEEFT